MPATNDRERPATREERARMGSEVKDLGGGLSLLKTTIALFLILFLAGFGIVAIFHLPKLAGRSAAGLIAGLAAARMYTRMRKSLTRSPYADLVRADLAGGMVRESAFDVVDAIRRDELEDEGAHFYLKLSNGRVLYLSGQYLDDEVESRRFPSSRVVIVRGSRSGTLLRFECSGAYVAPTGTLPAFTLEELDKDETPSDGDVLDVDFEKLRAEARAKAAT
jgi:hypothetical protein